jgi:PAS domain S-box-containing protein
MDIGIRTPLEHVEEALDAADMAWWELEFPSGALRFSKNKTDMLGYNKDDFIHFTHFTTLIHPKDYDASMKAMTDHYEGREEIYETTYRIKENDVKYILFHDKGRIVERNDQGFVVAGIVQKVA